VDDVDFLGAKRAEVERLEALAREILQANPYSESADEEEEAGWRELAHACRQMRPLLEAIERADARRPGYEKYREGFDFRLTEAMATVATLCSYGRLRRLHQQRSGRNDRPKAQSPFTKFIASRLKRDPDASAKEIETALVNDESGHFELSIDGLTILTTEDRPRQLKISGIPKAVTNARKKLLIKK
jgi:hypothetical protein